MGVRIDEINVEKAGPISELRLALGPFNLIYGRNEQGKTFLVEFLIRALFKNLTGWTLRGSDSRGKVVVSGLADRPVSLMPSSRRKLEDYLAAEEVGFPPRISRLLVVKGAELSFDEDGGGGVNHAVLKEFLSGQGLLDDLQRRISRTVQAARVEGGQIIGHNRGELKSRNQLSKEKRRLDDLFEGIEANVSGGERNALLTKVAELENRIKSQEKAKRHQAYLLHHQTVELEAEIDRLPELEVDQLAADFKQFTETKTRIGRLDKQLARLAAQSEHHEWLDQALSVYEQQVDLEDDGVTNLLPLLVGLCLLSGVVLSFLELPVGTLALALVAAGLGWLYWRRLQDSMERALDLDERKKLEAEFELRFGRPLSGSPLMRETLKTTAAAFHGAEAQRENLIEEKEQLGRLTHQIEAQLRKLCGESPELAEWERRIESLSRKRRKLGDQLNRRQLQLAALGVKEEEYRSEASEVAYDANRLLELMAERDVQRGRLQAKTTELENLKHRTSQETSDDISAEWTQLIEKLQQRREEIAAQYRDVTSEIVAGTLVNDAMLTIRSQEDEKIREKLASDQVSLPIQSITRRYTGVRLEEGQLSLIDDYGGFPISDLSTGAREQVLLALRLGFAAQNLGHSRLFLLLDDAFQHADWQRRIWLMDQMVRLAQEGWQIIYFTMDDNIKSLFDKAGSFHFGDQYRGHDLTQLPN